MKRALEKTKPDVLWYYDDGIRREGVPAGITGNLTGIKGDLSACEITYEDREKGINIEDLINKEE